MNKQMVHQSVFIEWDTCIEHWESYGCLPVMGIAWFPLVILLCLRNSNFRGRVPSPQWTIPRSPEFLVYVECLESWSVKYGLLWLCLWSKEGGDMMPQHQIIPKLWYGGHSSYSVVHPLDLSSHCWGVSSLCFHCPSLSNSLYRPHLFHFLCPRYVGGRRPLSCEPLLPRRNQLSLTLPCRDLQQPHQTSCVLPLCCRLLLPRKYHQLQYESLPSWLLLPQRWDGPMGQGNLLARMKRPSS